MKRGEVMSYDDARRQFEENVSLTNNTDNRAGHIIWNLNAGLANIAEGLNNDLSEIKDNWQIYYRGSLRLNRSRR